MHYLRFYIVHPIIHDFIIRTGYQLFLRHHGIYPLLRLLLRDMIALHDALQTNGNGSRDTYHLIEMGTTMEPTIEEDGTLHPLTVALLEITSHCGMHTSFTACLFASPVRINWASTGFCKIPSALYTSSPTNFFKPACKSASCLINRLAPASQS